MGEQWYTNKELFELINQLQKEMQETRMMIKKYNGLYQKVDEVSNKIKEIESEAAGRMSVIEAIHQWGGWLFGLITLLILVYTTF